MPKNPPASHCNTLLLDMFGFRATPPSLSYEDITDRSKRGGTTNAPSNEPHGAESHARMRPPPSLPPPPPPTFTFVSTLDDHGRVFERFLSYFRSAVGTSDASSKAVYKTWIRINDYAETRLLPASAISQWADHSKLFDDVVSVDLVAPTPMSIATCVCFEAGLYVGRVSDLTRNTVVVLTSNNDVKEELHRIRDRYQLGGCLQVILADSLVDDLQEHRDAVEEPPTLL